jgi:hypothetical protein
MTSFAEIHCKCALCDHTYESVRLCTSYTWGEPDLDFRPAPAERSTLGVELYICPHCGYVQQEPNKIIDPELQKAEKDLISTDQYKNPYNGMLNNLSAAFVNAAMIDEVERSDNIYLDLLKAAWAHEWWESSPEDEIKAVILRKKAITYLEHKKNITEEEAYQLIDMLRRTGQFERVIAKEVPYEIGDDEYRRVYDFQIMLSEKRDAGVHTFEELEHPEETRTAKNDIWEEPIVDPRIYEKDFQIEVDENDPRSVISNAIADRMEELFRLRETVGYVPGCDEENSLKEEIDSLMEESVKLSADDNNRMEITENADEETERIRSVIDKFIHIR